MHRIGAATIRRLGLVAIRCIGLVTIVAAWFHPS